MDGQPIPFEQLQAMAGPTLGRSRWYEVGQERIDRFADVTEDRQFIHVDPQRAAAETPLGGTVAHGLLTLSPLPAMSYEVIPVLDDMAMSINYGYDKVRFVEPVPSGARVRGHFQLLEVASKPGMRVLLRIGVEIEIEHRDKPALAAESLALVVRQ